MAEPTTFVSLNVGSQSISMATFAATPDGGLLLNNYAATELLGDPAADAARIAQIEAAVKELSERLGQKKARVRYAISGQSVFTRFVKLPPLTEEKVDQIVEFEAQQNVPFPINEVVWDYQLLGGSKAEAEAVIVAIKSEALNEIDEAVGKAGLVTQTVDISPMALYNAFRYNYSEITEPALLVDIGARTTNLIYIEGPNVFTRSIPVGGSTVTTAISKEFQAPFLEAEQKKIQDGFVNLGGAYADHEDAAIDGMSKVIRNTLTRLHGEVVRTNNFYRTQQGGTPPSVVYLCGATASMPYIREFFEDKLNLPVEFFNPLRNVLVGPGTDADEIAANAHKMGELVGLGLRGLSSCPMELDLVPEGVERSRALSQKKPSFILAGAAAVVFLGAAGLYYKRGAELANERADQVASDVRDIDRYSKKIKEWEDVQVEVDAKTEPFADAVVTRIFWVSLLDDLNDAFTTDKLWLTQVEPLSNGEPVTDSLYAQSGFAQPGDDEEDGEERQLIDAIKVSGLYRDNSQIVDQFYLKLVDNKNFALEGRDKTEVVRVLEQSREKWANTFEMTLPLSPSLHIAVE